MSNNQNKQPHTMPSIGLDESHLSAYAKAVNAINTTKKQGYILMGQKTPPLLRFLLNIGDLRSYTEYTTLRDHIIKKHHMPAKILLQIPYEVNNPIAILRSSDKARKEGFIFLTDLEKGKNSPVLVPFHRKFLKNGNQTLFMPTSYGKNPVDFQLLLNNDVLVWDYSRAENFEKRYKGVFDLPKHIYPTEDYGDKKRSSLYAGNHSPHLGYATQQMLSGSFSITNAGILFVDYDRTERYLSQYFSDLSVNPNLYLDENQVNEVRKWTRQHAPMTRNEAEQALNHIYFSLMLPDTAKQAIQDEIKNELDPIYDTRTFITGTDLPQFHQKAEAFSEEYLNRPLTCEQAKLVGRDMISQVEPMNHIEFIELFNNHIEKVYNNGGDTNIQSIQNCIQQMVKKIPDILKAQQAQTQTQPEKDQSKEKGDGGRER